MAGACCKKLLSRWECRPCCEGRRERTRLLGSSRGAGNRPKTGQRSGLQKVEARDAEGGSLTENVFEIRHLTPSPAFMSSPHTVKRNTAGNNESKRDDVERVCDMLLEDHLVPRSASAVVRGAADTKTSYSEGVADDSGAGCHVQWREPEENLEKGRHPRSQHTSNLSTLRHGFRRKRELERP